jgi:hypothetical protein
MQDGGGHQMAHIEYPGLPTDYVMEMVHRFYDEYYFRPKAALPRGVEGHDESRSASSVRRSQGVPQAARAAQQDGEGDAQAAGYADRPRWAQARRQSPGFNIEGGVRGGEHPPSTSLGLLHPNCKILD